MPEKKEELFSEESESLVRKLRRMREPEKGPSFLDPGVKRDASNAPSLKAKCRRRRSRVRLRGGMGTCGGKGYLLEKENFSPSPCYRSRFLST